jgi:hypothetical protein
VGLFARAGDDAPAERAPEREGREDGEEQPERYAAAERDRVEELQAQAFFSATR